jgi:flagellar export protein FliJ
MTTHRFRLQAVLDWRREQDEAAQRALGVARQALHDAETRLAFTHARLEDARATTRAAEAAGSDGVGAAFQTAQRAWHWNWIVGREDDVRTAESGVHECRTAVTKASSAAQDARRGLRTLERLRDRALETHTYQQKRLEQQALDALATTRFIRREAGM